MAMAGEGQHELVMHEVALEGGPLAEEPFLREGEGSAFVSRPNVLVLVTSTDRGLASLTRKVEQLVGRGFHHMALELRGAERLTPEAWAQLKGALAYTDQFAGWLALCGLSPALRRAVDAAAAEDDAAELVHHVAGRDEAVSAFRRLQDDGGGQGGADPLLVQSGDALLESADATASADDDWGDWGDDDPSPKDSGRLPRVDVGEMLVEADDLPRLRAQVQAALQRGRKYFTLRLHFKRDRRLTSEDMQALVAARDVVARGKGQLVLAALQDDVLKWLRLLGEDRHFTIVEHPDEAERLHRRHASGEVLTPPAPAAEQAAFVMLSRDASGGNTGSVVIRPTSTGDKTGAKTGAKGGGKHVTARVRVITLGRDGLAGLPVRVKRLAAEGVHDVVADLARFKEIRGESFDALPRALEAAEKAGARLTFGNVSREVRALLKILGVAEGGQGGTSALADTVDGALLHLAAVRPAFEELRLELSAEALDEAPPLDPVSSVDLDDELALGDLPPRRDDGALRAQLAQVEAERDELRRRVKELDAKAGAVPGLEQARARAERALEELRASGQQDQARLEQRLQALARDLDARRARIAELELTLQAGDAQADEVRRDAEGRAGLLEQELQRLRDRAQELEAGALRLELVERAQAEREAQLAERDARIDALEARARELKESLERERAALASEREAAAGHREAAGRASDEALRAQALEADLAARDRELDALQGELTRVRAAAAPAPAPAPVSDGDGDGARVAELERENARILAEAAQEIERLMQEQQLLREELESAGEMIERLGKELEFS